MFSCFRGQRIWLLAVAATLWCANAGAHEIGKSQVSVALRDAGFDVDVIVDPDALLSKLEAFGGRTVSRDLSKTERDRRIRALSDVFLEQTEIRFDGRSVRPRFEYVPASAFNDLAQAPSHVRLSGPLPAGARDLDFRYGLALGTYALNARIGDGPVQTRWIVGGATSEPFSLASPPPPPTRVEVAWQYLTLGFTHIVPHGLDHILFVLGIFLLTSRWRSVVAQVSTFTIAHSITLALTMYGVVSLPAKVVEPMIALSIVYVAIENLMVRELKPWRLALVFSFGLLHGMGFAGVLRDLGLPRPQFLTALVSFNLGVEGGQLSVIAGACLAIAAVRRVRLSELARDDLRSLRLSPSLKFRRTDVALAEAGQPDRVIRLQADRDSDFYRRFIVQPASILIAAVGLFWTIQRAL